MAIIGVMGYCVINVVFAFAVLAAASGVDDGSGVTVGFGAAALFLLTFGGGAALIAMRKPWAKGLGLGLMIGWALVSITSVGFCTGLNPEMYTGGIS